MKQYNYYCTEEQTRKAYNLDAPLEVLYKKYQPENCVLVDWMEDEDAHSLSKFVEKPTVEQLLEWIRKEKNIDVELSSTREFGLYYFSIVKKDKFGGNILIYNSVPNGIALGKPDVYLAAINKIFENLT